MQILLADNSTHFDPEVISAFIRTMGIYPIGSMILLNNGFIGRITEARKDAPLRPKLSLLIDQSGRLLNHEKEENIDLLNEKTLFIVRAVNPKELSRDGF
jgi:hypothetical protein